MGYFNCGATASCTVNHRSTIEAALAVYDYFVNHPDEIPETIDEDDDMDSDATVACLEKYMSCQSDGTLVISYDNEESNYSSSIFNFLSSHFACLQSSHFMTVNWWTADSSEGYSSGTDYYDRQGNPINVPEILNKYLDS